ncbi:hypothetical protein OFO16_01905 [Vibrio natriegens]|uniref:hypothetical protein n=1 Tax=Vibrio natriegens TaxID=691 RepID=UPI0021E79E1C|nr:hypothetical protein [Vibrio natriegens]UYI47475.1 hypothetical protein OFO16_01880 [Vibrio natriegens]UYI47480.1 hypothetical protein OFO16_01905 [Vibrio natriegens]
MILKLSELASQEKTALNDDRLPSVVIGLSFSNVISTSNQQHSTTAPETAANHWTGIHTRTEKNNGTLDYSANPIAIGQQNPTTRTSGETLTRIDAELPTRHT